MSSVSRIPPHQLATHLRLGRALAQFVGVGEYFGDRTFDWLRLDGPPDACRATLVRSVDEGAAHFTEVQTFETIDNDPGLNLESFAGPLPEVLAWSEQRFGAKPNAFHALNRLDVQYAALVAKGELGRR